METKTISSPRRAEGTKKAALPDTAAIEELNWIKEQAKGPLHVYSTFGGLWAVEYRGLAKVRLTLSALAEELLFLRESVYVMPADDLKAECLERGWLSIAT